MDNPLAFKPDQPVTTVGRIFGSPLAVQGISWLPANQLFTWALFAWLSRKQHGGWSAWRHLWLGGLKMAVLLGSEWCHNLAHAAAARAVGQPVDRVRIILGMPVLLYDEPEHPAVTPRQHLARSLGGPLCNVMLWALSKVFQGRTPPGSPAREVVDVAVGMNTFLASASLLPISVFDGGPVVKWALVMRGLTPAQAEAALKRVNRALGPGLVGVAAAAAARRSWLVALVLALLGGMSLWEGRAK